MCLLSVNSSALFGQKIPVLPWLKEAKINSVHTRDIVKTTGFTRWFVKLMILLIQWFSFGIPREQVLLIQIKNPQKVARKVYFSEPRLLQCT